METAPPTPRVLVIGLDPFRVPGPWDPAPAAEGIEVGRASFVEHGVPARFCLVGLDGTDDVGAVVAEALRAETWECVVVGGGDRLQRHPGRHLRGSRSVARRAAVKKHVLCDHADVAT